MLVKWRQKRKTPIWVVSLSYPHATKKRVGEVGGQSVGGVSLSVLQSVWKRLAGNNRAVMEVTVWGEACEAASSGVLRSLQ